MKNTSFVLAYCLIAICSIFTLHAKVTFAEVTPTPIPDCLCAVSGRVIDAISKKGIGNATVCSFDGPIRYTDTSGHYTWDNGIIPCSFGWTYALTASAEGYLSLTQAIYTEPCIEGTLKFELQPITTPTPTVTPTPWLITEDATNITSNSATLNATVPLVVGYVYFEYGTASGSYTSSVDAVREDTSERVSADISGLSPATTYFDRVVVFEKPPGGYTYGNEESFTTLSATPTVTPTPQPPTVTTGEASVTGDNSVILEGIVNGHGLLTTAWFDYGTSSGSYNNKSSTQTVTGTTDTQVSINIGKLLEETIYYYRIAAQNSAGISYGDERYFGLIPSTPTATPTPGCKAEEITASPPVLRLKKEESDDVTVTVTGREGCAVVGETVTAKIKSGKKRISVTPLSQITDANGNAIFTITATKKTGNAKVRFVTTSGLKATVVVKVKKD